MTKSRRLPRICVTATGETAAALLDCARRALAQSRFVELRLDWLPNPSEALPRIAELLASARKRPILQATCRRQANGGRFSGTVAQQLEILRKAAAAGCVLVDLEIESAEAAGGQAVAELRRAARVILSFHDFESSPSLAPVARRLRRFSADYYKVVTTATRQSHNCAVLKFLEDSEGTEDPEPGAGKWIAFCMGEAGVPSRVLALSRGSALVYAAPSSALSSSELEAVAAAPGQLEFDTLRNRYRAERLTRETRIYGLLGNPVRHSVGAAIHNAAFRARRLDAVYVPLLASDLNDFRNAARRYPLSGFSVTIPHKEAILRWVDHADPWVKAAGAANTVRVRRGRWEATNTDIEGIRVPLRKVYRLAQQESLPRGFRAVIVGNGGAARAAVIALRSLRCRNISVTGRNPAKVRRFARALDLRALPMEKLGTETFDLLVNATSVGMWPHEDECLLRSEQIASATVFDLVYNPPETRLLRLARERGCRVISGLEMFLAQAARQFEYWTGAEPPPRLMRKVAIAELARLRGSTA
ncbi:MAG TPA: shikimate dehydrogenase [Terriglobia bacterium]